MNQPRLKAREKGQSTFRKLMWFFIIILLIVVFTGCTATPPETPSATETPIPSEIPPTETPSGPFSSWVADEITSPALEGNLIGDPATREYVVYLPPSYATGNHRYPVLYVLHNWNGQNGTLWQEVSNMKETGMLDGDGLEMIIVFVNASNAFGGGFYGSSPALGDYETYIVHDLVNYLDAKYRTIPDRNSRGITGWGMGGYGATRLAFKHPDMFGVLAEVTGPTIDIIDLPFWDPMLNSLKELPTNLNELAQVPCVPNCYLRFLMIFAAEAAPNPENPPFFLDMPVTMVDGKAQIVPEIAEKIKLLNTPNLIPGYLEQPVRLNAILLYHGANDQQIPQELYDAWDELLTQNGIEHEYLALPGGLHRVPYNLALEFMVKHLSSEMP